MAQETEMITGWYGNLQYQNEEQRQFMLATGTLFEQHSIENSIDDDKLLNEIRNKFPLDKLFTRTYLENNEVMKKFRQLITGTGLEANPPLPDNTFTPIKIAHIIYPGDEFQSERTEALKLIDIFRNNEPNDNSKTDLAGTSTQNTENSNKKDESSQPEDYTSASSDVKEEENTLLLIQKSLTLLNTKFEQQQELISKKISAIQDQIDKKDEENCKTKQTISKKSIDFTKQTVVQEKNPYNFVIGNQNNMVDSNTNENGEYNCHNNKQRLHHDLAQRFKDKEGKYAGTDDEDLIEHLSNYETVTEDYGATDEQKLKYIHNILKGEALRYFNSEVKQRASSFEETKQLLLSHFNSPDVQARIKCELQTINFQSYVEKEGSKSKALSSMANHISNRSQKCPAAFRHEMYRVEFLRKALMRETWAKTILLEVDENTKYQKLYTKLANALQFHEETDGPSLKREAYGQKSSKPTIFFTQPKYGKQVTNRLFSGSQFDKTCWNCGKRGHRHSKCHQKPDPVRIAAAKAQFLERKNKYRKQGMNPTKQVLFEMVEELRDIIGGSENSDDDNPAKTFFGNADSSSCSDDSSESENDGNNPAEEHFNMSIDASSDEDF